MTPGTKQYPLITITIICMVIFTLLLRDYFRSIPQIQSSINPSDPPVTNYYLIYATKGASITQIDSFLAKVKMPEKIMALSIHKEIATDTSFVRVYQIERSEELYAVHGNDFGVKIFTTVNHTIADKLPKRLLWMKKLPTLFQGFAYVCKKRIFLVGESINNGQYELGITCISLEN
jgi:hypothetical protein